MQLRGTSFILRMKSRVLLRSEVGMIMVSICLHGVISWSQASGRGRFGPTKTVIAEKYHPSVLKFCLTWTVYNISNKTTKFYDDVYSFEPVMGLSIPKALHIDVWEMSGVTAMAAGGDKDQSLSELRQTQTGVCFMCVGPPTPRQISLALRWCNDKSARWVLGRYHNTSSVTDMLSHLGWRSQEMRRADARLCMLYKMSNGLVALDTSPQLVKMSGLSANVHPHRFVRPPTANALQENSFFPRTILPVGHTGNYLGAIFVWGGNLCSICCCHPK